MSAPAARYLSLGAGIQSSTCLLLAIQGKIPSFDAAVFADTGWEPAAVYTHLDRLERLAATAGIPVVRVRTGNIRADALDPAHRFASMPLFTLGPNGERGMARRQCTTEYKIKPIKAEVRRRLGYPHPQRIPAGVFAEISIGISVDEVHRARDADVAYMRNVFPLLDLGWRRSDCVAYLAEHGLGTTPRSACLGCPYHTDAEWARLREHSPAEWADAVAFDTAIRNGSARANADGHPLRGQFFLHRQRVPLDQVRLRPQPGDEADTPGCGPWTCPHPDEQAPAAAIEADGAGMPVREVA
jgi:3'-phosphoadenosine 5'-phosphosulfate sulfotransferase (PAPS reductase)/FAD synthetase